MSTNGEAADLAVHESIEVTESAMKQVGLGAKNLAALLIAVANDNQKVAGVTNLRRLMQDGDQKVVFSVKADDMKEFAEKAKDFGVLYVTVKHKGMDTDTFEIITRASDAQMINHIMERMGYPAPAREDAAAKKAEPRVPSERSSKERGRGATETPTESTAKKTSSRKSIKPTLNGMRQKSEVLDKRNRAREAVKTALNKAAPER
jgi:hypothetical protein